MNIASIGIDLGKTTFHLVALGERNKILLRRKFSRTQLLAYTANLPASLIGLEACTPATLRIPSADVPESNRDGKRERANYSFPIPNEIRCRSIPKPSS